MRRAQPIATHIIDNYIHVEHHPKGISMAWPQGTVELPKAAAEELIKFLKTAYKLK